MSGLILLCLAPFPVTAQKSVPDPVIHADFTSPNAFNLHGLRSVQACRAIVSFARDSAARTELRDTTYIDEDRPTPSGVSRLASQCLNQFSITTLDTLEWPTVMELALLTGDTVPVKATLDRMLTLRGTTEEQVAMIINTIDAMKGRLQPVPLPFIRSLLARLDSYGDAARYEQAWARSMVYDSYKRRGVFGDTLIEVARDALSAYQLALKEGGLGGTKRATAELLVAFLQQQLTLYTYLQNGTAQSRTDWIATVVGARQDWKKIQGRNAPPIAGEFWMIRDDSGTAAHPAVSVPERVPALGEVSLVVGLREELSNLQAGRKWDMLRRVWQRFPSVKIVLLAETRGAVWNTIRTTDPATEAQFLGQFYLDSLLKIPALLNVSTTVIDTTIRNPSGQPAIFASQTFESWRYTNPINSVYLIDHQGYVVDEVALGRGDLQGFLVLVDGLVKLAKQAAAH